MKDIGTHAVTFYFDERRRMITGHNDAIRRAIEEDTEALREASRGDGVVVCPDCGMEVAWGNILPHRLEICKNKRV